jgi:hypothetical protein
MIKENAPNAGFSFLVIFIIGPGGIFFSALKTTGKIGIL